MSEHRKTNRAFEGLRIYSKVQSSIIPPTHGGAFEIIAKDPEIRLRRIDGIEPDRNRAGREDFDQAHWSAPREHDVHQASRVAGDGGR